MTDNAAAATSTNAATAADSASHCSGSFISCPLQAQEEGHQATRTATASEAVGSATLQTVPGNSSGTCSASGAAVTCLLTVDGTGLAIYMLIARYVLNL